MNLNVLKRLNTQIWRRAFARAKLSTTSLSITLDERLRNVLLVCQMPKLRFFARALSKVHNQSPRCFNASRRLFWLIA